MKNAIPPIPGPLGRRAVLARNARAAGAAVVGPWIIPGLARGAGGRPAPGNRITIGLIGTGRQGRVHLGLAAIHLGRKLRWDPVNESVVGDDAAGRRLLEPAAARSLWREIAP